MRSFQSPDCQNAARFANRLRKALYFKIKMRTYPLINEQQQLHAFEINNTFKDRKAVTKIIEKIPNVQITKRPKLLSWFRDGDIFCIFKLNNNEFTVEEPFGDNSRYLIGANPPGHCAEIDIIEEAFKRA